MSAGEFKDWSKNDLVREVLRLRRLLSDQMSAAPGVGDEVVVEGIVGLMSGEPLVQCRAGEAAWQWDTGQAREHAYAVLERAIEAERDAGTIAFLREAGMGDEEAGGFIAAMRDRRKHFVAEVRECTS